MNAAARLVEVRVPDMGNFKDVAIIDVLVKTGDSIEPEGSLITLETEKATMDVPSTVGGVIEKLHVAKGGKVSAGDLVATVRTSDSAGTDAAREAPQSDASAPRPPPAEAAKPVSTSSTSTQPSAAQSAPAQPPSPEPEALSRTPASPPPMNEPGFSRAHAGPSVRKLARELGVDLTEVTGGGFKGRITHEDVKAYVKKSLAGPAAAVSKSSAAAAVTGSPTPSGASPTSAPPRPAASPAAAGASAAGLPKVPVIDFSLFGPVESKPLSRIQRISGPRLHASWVNLPHVTQFDDADITELEDVRTKLKQKALQEGIKLTPLAFIMRACVKALQEFPHFNASLDATGANLILKKYINVGFAADTPNGLVVPVVQDANQKDIYEIARRLGELSEKARAGKLAPGDMQGGCFTISSLGGIGGTAFTPIINAPEVAILGVSKSSMRPVYRDGGFIPRLILPLSLSYDHRVIDGASAARFTTYLAKVLAEPRSLTEAVP